MLINRLLSIIFLTASSTSYSKALVFIFVGYKLIIYIKSLILLGSFSRSFLIDNNKCFLLSCFTIPKASNISSPSLNSLIDVDSYLRNLMESSAIYVNLSASNPKNLFITYTKSS